MIDPVTVERIISAAQIVDVVSEFVTLRKRGVNYVGLCPFHDDKSPSFSVSPAKGVCKCFSCGKGGSAVQFIMDHEQLTYVEALRYLARKYHIEIKERELTDEERQSKSIRESMFIVNDFARTYFQQTLRENTEGRSIGMAYLRQRGFRDDIIEKFQLGYSIDNPDAFAREAIAKGYSKEMLLKTGLCYENDRQQLRDRFRGRVIFPVHTLAGKVVAFGGRVLSTQTKGVQAKYVNSPESEIYHKSNELYGIFLARKAIQKQDRIFLVEGYTDVISMHQSGVENVVASSGTALTPGQIRLMHNLSENISVLYDGDPAGIKASLRGIDMLLEAGMNVKVCLLPDGEDPDSFARQHNSESFQSFIREHEVDFIRFKTDLLMQDAEHDPLKQAELIKSIVQSIAVIPDAIKRDVFIRESARQLQVRERLLVEEVAKHRENVVELRNRPSYNPANAQAAPHPAESVAPAENAPQNTSESPETYQSLIPREGQEKKEFYRLERLILRTLVRYGERTMGQMTDAETGEAQDVSVIEYIMAQLQIDELKLHNPLHQQMLEEAFAHRHEVRFSAAHYFTVHPDPNVSKLAASLLIDKYQLSKRYTQQPTEGEETNIGHAQYQKFKNDEERLCEITCRLMIDFKYAIVKEELRRIEQALKNPDVAADAAQCDAMMRRHIELEAKRIEFAKLVGDRVVG